MSSKRFDVRLFWIAMVAGSALGTAIGWSYVGGDSEPVPLLFAVSLIPAAPIAVFGSILRRAVVIRYCLMFAWTALWAAPIFWQWSVLGSPEGGDVLALLATTGIASTVGAVSVVAIADVCEARRSHRMKHGLCAQCGYDLRGSESTACPECGAAKIVGENV